MTAKIKQKNIEIVSFNVVTVLRTNETRKKLSSNQQINIIYHFNLTSHQHSVKKEEKRVIQFSSEEN